MRKSTLLAVVMISVATLIAAACAGNKSGGSNSSGSSASFSSAKTIKFTTAGSLTVTLASDAGELKSGDNDLILSFADSSGKTVDVGAASLRFHMPAMGSMVEMNDVATLTTTDTPGKYRAKVNIEIAGTWEAMVNYQGPQGTGQASMTVIAK